MLLHNFIQQSLNSVSVQVQTLLVAHGLAGIVQLELTLNAFYWSIILQKQFIIIITTKVINTVMKAIVCNKEYK